MWRVKQRVFAEIHVDIVVASRFMLDMAQRSPFTSHLQRIHHIPFGIEADAFLPEHEKPASRARLGIPNDDFVVLFRSASAEAKGLTHIIKALAAKPPSRPTTLLTLDRKHLVKSLSSHYNIVELGWVESQSRLARAFSACDVFLMPSTAEAFGLMALEAMAAGRPTVCFEGTSLPSITHAPNCGIAVSMGDHPALRAAIDDLSRNPDEARRRGGRANDRSRGRTARQPTSISSPPCMKTSSPGPARRTMTRANSAEREARARAHELPLAGVRICLVFEHSLSHYSRLLMEIEALQAEGASVRLLTSHGRPEDAPPDLQQTIAPLDSWRPGSRIRWRPARIAHNVTRNVLHRAVRWAYPRRYSRLRVSALEKLAGQVDLFWVIDYPSLPTVVHAAEKAGARVLYETVDLVPEYQYRSRRELRGERRVVGRVDGFITACDSYADYYMERYGGAILPRRPVVRDNMPPRPVATFRPSRSPLRLIFLRLGLREVAAGTAQHLRFEAIGVRLEHLGPRELRSARQYVVERPRHSAASRGTLAGVAQTSRALQRHSAQAFILVALSQEALLDPDIRHPRDVPAQEGRVVLVAFDAENGGVVDSADEPHGVADVGADIDQSRPGILAGDRTPTSRGRFCEYCGYAVVVRAGGDFWRYDEVPDRRVPDGRHSGKAARHPPEPAAHLARDPGEGMATAAVQWAGERPVAESVVAGHPSTRGSPRPPSDVRPSLVALATPTHDALSPAPRAWRPSSAATTPCARGSGSCPASDR